MIKNLIEEVIPILSKNEISNDENKNNFNIFEITGIENDEVKICKVIYELLSPNGGHRQKYAYLKLFFEEVLHLDISQEELETTIVYREYLIDAKRRIDLVIKTAKRQIPIEVKINAVDQRLQCYDYIKAAVNSKLYYLTLHGRAPSEFSVGDVELSQIISLSFERDILNWLSQCLLQEDTRKNVLICQVIKQFVVAICQITDQPQVERRKEIIKTLISSPDNFKSAVEISNCIDDAKQKIIRHAFDAIEEKVNRKKLENEYDYKCNPDTIDGFYKHRQSECPGISYKYKETVKPGIDIWVRIEIESNSKYDNLIYSGYYCTKDGHKQEGLLSNVEIEDILNVPPWVDRWWAYYEYLPEDDVEGCPNFRYVNEPFFNLLDDEYFDDFTTKCAEKVEELLNR